MKWHNVAVIVNIATPVFGGFENFCSFFF